MRFSDIYAPMKEEFQDAVEKHREKAKRTTYEASGKELLKEILKSCSYKGKSVADCEDGPELDEMIDVLATKTLEHSGKVCSAASMVGGKLKDKLSDMALDQLCDISDVVYAVTCSEFNPVEGIHTTVVKAPKQKISGDFILATFSKFLEDVFSRSYDIKDPVDLHTMVYNALMLMGVAQAKIVARAHVKNIDKAGLLENRVISELVNDADTVAFSNNLKGKNFFTEVTNGNSHLEELDKARAKESEYIEKHSEGGTYVQWDD